MEIACLICSGGWIFALLSFVILIFLAILSEFLDSRVGWFIKSRVFTVLVIGFVFGVSSCFVKEDACELSHRNNLALERVPQS